MSSSEGGQFKSFISEGEIEEKKRVRQEEWEKVRSADQPIEAPEEVHDGRSLYDKLKENKDKDQAEFEEQFKPKNFVRGLDDEEAQFLDQVSEKTVEIVRQREMEDFQVLREYKKALVIKPAHEATTSVEAKPKVTSSKAPAKKLSQSQLLLGAVKRKGSEADTVRESEKKLKTNGKVESTEAAAASNASDLPSVGASKIVAVLPGIGSYTESTDSDSNSSDSDIDITTFKRIAHVHLANCQH